MLLQANRLSGRQRFEHNFFLSLSDDLQLDPRYSINLFFFEMFSCRIQAILNSKTGLASIMRRVQIFIIVFTVSLSAIFALLVVGVYLATVQPAQYSSSWVGQMWSGMGNNGMGGMMGSGSVASTPSYFWIIPAALIGIAIVGGIGLAFYVAFPEIRTMKEPGNVAKSEPSSVNTEPAPLKQ